MKTPFTLHAATCISLSLFFPACAPPPVDTAALIPPPGKYDARILRDSFGVPHIYGKTDADVAYGLAYAHCEDDFATLQEVLLLSRAKLSSVMGREAAPFDYLVQLCRFREMVDSKYETDLSPEVRAICEAYADGYNHYAALHPEAVVPGLLPSTGRDVVLGFVAKTPFFFGMDKEVRHLMGETRQHDVSSKLAARQGGFLTGNLPIGSNTFAIAPSRTPDGKTHLAINSHQPWTGPVAWYEARLKSEEGMDIIGGVFPGTPVVLHGHNRDLGWAHTVNSPDLVDIYVLEMNTENPNQYRFDGEWRDLEVWKVPVTVRLWGNLKWTFKREALFSVHGPVIRRPHGVYAIRYAGYGDIRQVEQWYRMGKSRKFQEFEDAMRMRAIPSFNVGYGDKEGNIWYLYNALFPLRNPQYDWSKYLPGDTSETLWTAYAPFEQMPQVKNPASGFIQNCNSTPYQTTAGAENPKPEDFSVTFGIETEMTNRGLRALELLSADTSITEEEFYAYKYDMAYSPKSKAAEMYQKILDAAPFDDPVVQEALEVLKGWDFMSNRENTGTAIAVLTMEPVVRAMMFGNPVPDLIQTFKEKAHLLQDTYGAIAVPWEQVNRLVRGTVNLGMGGGPDVLHAVYGKWTGKHLEGEAGDCYVLMVTWNPDGSVRSRSIHQFGSATSLPDSPHYTDQAPIFVARETKPVWLDESELRANLKEEYRPGDVRAAQ